MDQHHPSARLLGGLLLLVCACTETNIYHTKLEPNLPNKVAVSGTVCTDDPAQRQFPVRVMFIVDVSGTMGENDPNGQRFNAVQRVVTRYVASTNYSFAIVKYGGDVLQLTNGYTRNQTELYNAMTMLNTLMGCEGGCRDWIAALSLANSIFSGDVMTTNLGSLSRTRYVFIFVASGPPDPPIRPIPNEDVCARDWSNLRVQLVKAVEDMVTFGFGRGVAEVAFHTVQVDDQPGTCQIPGDMRYCGTTNPCPHDCAGTEECLTAQRLCADDPTTGCGDANGYCAGLGLGDCSAEFFCTGDMNTDCRGDAICAASGAGRCEFKRVCAADPATGCSKNEDCCARFPCVDPNRSCNDLTEELLTAMAFKGMGENMRFSLGSQLNFQTLNFDTNQSIFVKKAFMVSNANAKFLDGEMVPDSDGEGMSDREEGCYGEVLAGQCQNILKCGCTLDVWGTANPKGTDTDPALADTDGDWLSDMLETRFATLNLDPLRTDLPQACAGLDFPYKDRDWDGLNDCEEKLIGTDSTIFDTDRDGYPDSVEFRMGTNALKADNLQDSDLDGLVNGGELDIHLDPQVSDIEARSGKAYRYKVIDEGLRLVPYSSQPHVTSGVEVTDVSGRSYSGSGTLTFHPAGTQRPDGSQRGYPTLSWRDPLDGDNGPEVEITGSGLYPLYSACKCIAECATPCDPGEWCNPSTGTCDPDPCEMITCASMERCDAFGGRCLPDCSSTDCGLGQTCDQLLGKCLTDRCLNTDCTGSAFCDPEVGLCTEPICQGWACPSGLTLNRSLKPPWVTVRVDESQLPQSGMWCDGTPDNKPCLSDGDCPNQTYCLIRENIVVGTAQKNCISYKVKNITLVETLAVQGMAPGLNNILVYFAQTPLDNPNAYSIFRIAPVPPIQYLNGVKNPNWAEIPLDDGDFLAIEEK